MAHLLHNSTSHEGRNGSLPQDAKALGSTDHPYHEACPKCLRTKELLQDRLRRFESAMEKIRADMGLSASHYDTPEKIQDAVRTRILYWRQRNQEMCPHMPAPFECNKCENERRRS